MVRARVMSWNMYFAYESPHKAITMFLHVASQHFSDIMLWNLS